MIFTTFMTTSWTVTTQSQVQKNELEHRSSLLKLNLRFLSVSKLDLLFVILQVNLRIYRQLHLIKNLATHLIVGYEGHT